MLFAKRLEILMQENGITKYRLSKLLDCSATTVTNWLSGKEATQTYIQKLSEIFEVTTDYLLGKSEQKKKPAANDGSKLSIDERVEEILNGMANERSGSLMLDGKPASPEAVEALRQAIKMGVEYARKINSEKK